MDNNRRYNNSVSRETLRRQSLSGVAAAAVLGKRKSPADIIKISRMLNNHDPVVREETIKSLCKIGGRDSAMAIVPAFNDREPRVRAAACRAIGHMREHSAKNRLYDALHDKNAMVACCAAWALAAMGDKIGMPQIIKLIKSSGKHQWEAIRGLNLITGKNFRPNGHGLREALIWIESQRKHPGSP